MSTDYNAIVELGRGRDTADDIIDRLAGHGPVVSPNPRGLELIITLPAAGLGTAATTAIALTAQATRRPVISVQVMTTAEFDRRVDDDEPPAEELTVAQSAERLGVSAARVRQMIEEGKLPARRVGQRTLLIPAAAVNPASRSAR